MVIYSGEAVVRGLTLRSRICLNRALAPAESEAKSVLLWRCSSAVQSWSPGVLVLRPLGRHGPRSSCYLCPAWDHLV